MSFRTERQARIDAIQKKRGSRIDYDALARIKHHSLRKQHAQRVRTARSRNKAARAAGAQ